MSAGVPHDTLTERLRGDVILMRDRVQYDAPFNHALERLLAELARVSERVQYVEGQWALERQWRQEADREHETMRDALRERDDLIALQVAYQRGDAKNGVAVWEWPAPFAGSRTATPERDHACVERWPECESGAYDPRCCRFPKSCSCSRAATQRPRFPIFNSGDPGLAGRVDRAATPEDCPANHGDACCGDPDACAAALAATPEDA